MTFICLLCKYRALGSSLLILFWFFFGSFTRPFDLCLYFTGYY